MSNKIFDYPALLEGDEELIPLTEACKKFRPPISKPTIDRHYTVGVRGVILKTVRMGGIRCTNLTEIRRFELAQLPNPVQSDATGDESVSKSLKRSTRKASGRMTPEEIAAGLARHGLVHG